MPDITRRSVSSAIRNAPAVMALVAAGAAEAASRMEETRAALAELQRATQHITHRMRLGGHWT